MIDKHRIKGRDLLDSVTSSYRSQNKLVLTIWLYLLSSLFRFTAAIRTAFNFSGNEILTFSGGEELWVYIDKTLVVQLFSDPVDSKIPCRTISLTNAGKLQCKSNMPFGKVKCGK